MGEDPGLRDGGVHDRWTIVAMAVIASALGTLFHEALGHGVTASLRGDVVTELTSNHLSAVRSDRLVSAGGTVVNYVAGVAALLLSRGLGRRANARYFFWLVAAFNLLPAAGYFMLSGIFGIGDWAAVIEGVPHAGWVRVGMTLMGAGLTVWLVRLLAVAMRPYVPDEPTYNTVGRLPYVAAGVFSCMAGALDPLGWRMLLMSTVPAAFGGNSGLLWADSLMPRGEPAEGWLRVRRSRGWWVAAVLLGAAYVVVLGRGVRFGA